MQKDEQPVAGPPASTLLAASVDFTDQVELVEYSDRSVAICINGQMIDGYKWDASHADEGINTYWRMVRREP